MAMHRRRVRRLSTGTTAASSSTSANDEDTNMTRQTPTGTTSASTSGTQLTAKHPKAKSKWEKDAPVVWPKAYSDTCETTPVPVADLIRILEFQRFAGSKGEEDMIAEFLLGLPGITIDDYGNLMLTVKPADYPADACDPYVPTTLFSAHTDTVEKKTAEGKKELALTGPILHTKGGGVLGADDGAGIWIMLNLIKAGVPGLYIFHREEECGGGGSSYIAIKTPEVLQGIKRAVAFDRKGLTNVITHQGGRCCSDAFGDALADALNEGILGFKFEIDDSGVFTDTANYTELVPECTNLSVGYYDQHTTHECVDLSFITRLANACIDVKWDELPTERDPAEVEDYYYGSSYSSRFDRFSTRSTVTDERLQDILEVYKLIKEYPWKVAEMLYDNGYDVYEIEEVLFGKAYHQSSLHDDTPEDDSDFNDDDRRAY